MTIDHTALRPTRRTVLRGTLALGLTTYAAGAGGPAHAAPGESVWTAGLNADGQLGDGSTDNRASFALVADSGLAGVDDIAGGRQHALAMRDGTVYSWGNGGQGALGFGGTTDQLTPRAVPGLSGVLQVAAAHYGSYVLLGDRTVRSWGYNVNGQLGDGTLTRRLTPVRVSGLTDVRQVAAGRDMAMAVVGASRTVRTWGRGTAGELGNGTNTTSQTTPVPVAGLSGVAQLAGGRNHVLARLQDGTVWAWGDNTYGQVGDGTQVNRNRPARVLGLTDVIDVAAGAEFSVAVRGDGSVWTWGRSNRGQLGSGGTATRTVPGVVRGLPAMVGAGCGREHAVVHPLVGQAWGWGQDTYGQLGDRAGTARRSPVALPGMTGVREAHGGFGFTVLRRAA